MTLTDREYQRLRDMARAVMDVVGAGHRRLQRPVRRRTRRRRAGGHRDEPARQPQLGPGQQGHRLPHRQDRRPGGRGLHPGRDPQRHHARDAGQLRAVAGLRGGQDPALRLREVPRRRPDARAADEVGRRGHGHRRHLRRGAEQGAPRAGGRAGRLWVERPPASRSADAGERRSVEMPTGDAWAARRIGRGCARAPSPSPSRRRPPPSRRPRARRRRRSRRGGRGHRLRPLVRGRAGGAAAIWSGGWRGTRWTRCRRISCFEAKRLGLSDAPHRPPVRAARGWRRARTTCAPCARRWASGPSSGGWTPARPSSRPTRPTSTAPTRRAGEDEARPSERQKVMILGGGPNRIGQGIEFDYCCVHACRALVRAGLRDRHGQLQPRDRLDRLRHRRPAVLRAADGRGRAGDLRRRAARRRARPVRRADAAEPGPRRSRRPACPIWGTSPDTIDLAEDRERFGALLTELDIPQPEHGIAALVAEAEAIAERIGYPVLVRPSYVLGGRAMAIVYDRDELGPLPGGGRRAPPRAQRSWSTRYLEDAYEVDVDAVCDGERVVIGGVMQHIEEAGVHSGDSAMVLPPYRVSAYHLSVIARVHRADRAGLGREGPDEHPVRHQGRRGLRPGGQPPRQPHRALRRQGDRRAAGRASRPRSPPAGRWPRSALDRDAAGRRLLRQGGVLPFDKMPGAAVELGPEMRSTGEVMGHASQLRPRLRQGLRWPPAPPLPTGGTVLITVNDFDKAAVGKIARDLHRHGLRAHGHGRHRRLAGA